MNVHALKPLGTWDVDEATKTINLNPSFDVLGTLRVSVWSFRGPRLHGGKILRKEHAVSMYEDLDIHYALFGRRLEPVYKIALISSEV